MTAKEEAKELYNKMYKIINSELQFSNKKVDSHSKLCALTAVEEIIKQWEYIDTYIADMNGELNPNLKYWYDVKKELKLL